MFFFLYFVLLLEKKKHEKTKMKSFIVVALLAAICAVANTEDVCHTNVENVCGGSTTLSGEYFYFDFIF